MNKPKIGLHSRYFSNIRKPFFSFKLYALKKSIWSWQFFFFFFKFFFFFFFFFLNSRSKISSRKRKYLIFWNEYWKKLFSIIKKTRVRKIPILALGEHKNEPKIFLRTIFRKWQNHSARKFGKLYRVILDVCTWKL